MPLRTSSVPILHRSSFFFFFNLPPDSPRFDAVLDPGHVSSSQFVCMSPWAPSPVDDLRSASSSRGSGLCRAQSDGGLSLLSLAMQLGTDDRKELSFNGSRKWTKKAACIAQDGCCERPISKGDARNSEAKAVNYGAVVGRNGSTSSFRGDDGEFYSSIDWSSSGHPLACNEKGCRPLTGPECRKLGLQAFESASGGRGHFTWQNVGTGGSSDNGSSHSDAEAHYQKLLQSDPQNPLLLRNYAQFLLEQKGDIQRSEEYYGRAILAEPNDGEVLSQFAELQWNVHGDKDRAEAYYDQAIQAAPEDCYVMASYASFLWDAEENEDGNSSVPSTPAPQHEGVSPLPTPLLASA